ncbi:MAG: hypothetical protein ACRD96_19800 [Bryobacteraceae bacterium]
MALYTDSAVYTLEDLAGYETGLLDTASTEGINLTVKTELAREEVGLILLSALQRVEVPELSGHDLKNVVVTTPLRLWQIFHTLAIVYRDAYFNQLNDRYKGKWDEYRELGRFAAALLAQIGVGTVVNPVPEADAPLLSLVPGSLTAARYFVRVSWLNAAGQEGAPGKLADLDVPTGQGLQVTAVNQPSSATAYNVYAGVSPHDLFLQNTTPQNPSTPLSLAGPALASGRRPGSGQEPDFFRQVPRIIPRG